MDLIEYDYEGYRIRVRFSGERTFAQCMKNLMEREQFIAFRKEEDHVPNGGLLSSVQG